MGLKSFASASNNFINVSQTSDLFTIASNTDTSIGISENNIKLDINGKSIYNQTDSQIDIKVDNGSEILIDTLISIKNQNSSILTILTDINTTLSEMANASIPTTVPTTLGALNPDILLKIMDLNTLIPNLFK